MDGHANLLQRDVRGAAEHQAKRASVAAAAAAAAGAKSAARVTDVEFADVDGDTVAFKIRPRGVRARHPCCCRCRAPAGPQSAAVHGRAEKFCL